MTDNAPASADFMLLVDWQNELSDFVINGVPGLASAPRPTEADAAEIKAMLLAGTLGADHKFYESKREPRGLIRSAISNAWNQLQYDRLLAAKAAPETPQQEALRKAAKLAFGKKGTDAPLKHRADLRRLLISQGATSADADAQLAEIAAAFGTSLGSLAPGKTPKQFRKPESLDDIGNDGGGSDKPTKPAKKVEVPGSKNPWGSAPGAWSITQQGHLIRTLGIEKATAIAAAVGCKIGDTRPNPNFSK